MSDKLTSPWGGWKENDDQIERAYKKMCERFLTLARLKLRRFKNHVTRVLFGCRRARSLPSLADYVRLPTIGGYIGFTGHGNFGDEILYESVAHLIDMNPLITYNMQLPIELLPLARLCSSSFYSYVILGGGTLINNPYYLPWVQKAIESGFPLYAFGTGVRAPEFWESSDWGGAIPANRDEWSDVLAHCGYVGVRGPRSARILHRMGVRNIEVVGDPVIAWPYLQTAKHREPEGRVVVNMGLTGPMFGFQNRVLNTISTIVAMLLDQGRSVEFVSLNAIDVPLGQALAKRFSSGAVRLWTCYRDLRGTCDRIRNADLVICERLHCAIVAAASGVPVIALAYRPKIFDFAESYGIEDYVIRTDRLTARRLRELVEKVTGQQRILRSQLLARTEQYRARLVSAARSVKFLISDTRTEVIHGSHSRS